MINPVSTGPIQNYVMTLRSSQLQQAKTDIQTRIADMNQMRADLQSGDTAGAAQEQAAAQAAQQQVLADQAGMQTLHQEVSKLREDFKAHYQDVKDYHNAMKAGDTDAANAALQAMADVKQTIQDELTQIGYQPTPAQPISIAM